MVMLVVRSIIMGGSGADFWGMPGEVSYAYYSVPRVLAHHVHGWCHHCERLRAQASPETLDKD